MQKINLLLFLMHFSAWAAGGGNGIGNGGPVFAYPTQDYRGCKSLSSYTRAEIVDYHFARKEWGLLPDLGAPEDWKEVPGLDLLEEGYLKPVKFVLHRLRRLSPDRAERYWKSALEFQADHRKRKDVCLTRIPDDNLRYTPVGADPLQIVIHSDPKVPEDARYLVSEDLWKLLDETNRAGLILHEVIYREALENGQDNSYLTQYFNAWISSKKIETLTQEQFNDLLKRVSFKTVEIQGLPYDVKSLKFHSPHQVASGKIVDVGSWNHEGVLLSPYSGDVSFYGDGKLESASSIRNASWVHYGTSLIIGGRTSFFPNGSLKSTDSGEPVSWLHNGFPLQLTGGDLTFYSSGLLKSAVVAHASPVLFQGKVAIVDQGPIEFYEDGSLRRAAILSIEVHYGKNSYRFDKTWTAARTTIFTFTPEGYFENYQKEINGRYIYTISPKIWIRDRWIELSCLQKNPVWDWKAGKYQAGCQVANPEQALLVQNQELPLKDSDFSLYETGLVQSYSSLSTVEFSTPLGDRFTAKKIDFHLNEMPRSFFLENEALLTTGSGQKLFFRRGSIELYPTGHVKVGTLREATQFRFSFGEMEILPGILKASSENPSGTAPAWFHVSGALLKGELAKPIRWMVQGKKIKIGSKRNYLRPCMSADFRVGKSWVNKVYSRLTLELYPDQKLRSAHLAEDTELLLEDGSIEKIEAESWIQLNENDRVDLIKQDCKLSR